MVYRLLNGILRKTNAPGGAGILFVLTDFAHIQRDRRYLPIEMEQIDLQAEMKRTRIVREAGHLYGALSGPRPGHSSARGGSTFFFISPMCVAIVGETAGDLTGVIEAVAHKAAVKMTPARLVLLYLESQLQGETIALEKLEGRISRLEDAILSGSLDGFLKRISPIRRELRRLHLYYERVADIIDVLIDDEEDLFEEESDGYYRQLSDTVKRLIDEAAMLRDYALQVQQIYQAQVDIRQNNIMRVLTVVTTIFFPLSLITSWYGMNFTGMNELEWEYGYLAVILLSAVIVLISLLIFKKKKYL